MWRVDVACTPIGRIEARQIQLLMNPLFHCNDCKEEMSGINLDSINPHRKTSDVPRSLKISKCRENL